MLSSNDRLCLQCGGDTIYSTVMVLEGGLVHDHCHKAYHNKVRGRPFKCPKCSGVGTEEDKSRPRYHVRETRSEDYSPDSGPGTSFQNYIRECVGWGTKPCTVCHGNGYTEKKIEPITQTTVTVIGYK